MPDKDVLGLPNTAAVLADVLEYQKVAGGTGSSKRTDFTQLRALFNFSLTTIGTSGPATYSGNVLNIPNYATGAGAVPTGTGFYHVTSGAMDAAARAINLNSSDVTGSLPTLETVVSGTSYTILSTDSGKVVRFTSSSPVSVTLPQAGTAGFGTGFSFIAKRAGAGTVTITPTTSTIGGAATLVLSNAQDSCGVYSDNTNYQTTPGQSTGAGGGANTALSNLASVAINTALVPASTDSAALGSTTRQWSDLFLATGGVLNWNNGNITLTHSAGILALAGGDLRVATAGVGTNADSVPTLSSTNTFTNKTLGTNCIAFALTTIGSSGPATYTGGTLNIPQYTGGGGVTLAGIIIGCEISWVSTTQISIGGGQLHVEGTNSIITVGPQTVTLSPTPATWYYGYVNSSGTFSLSTTQPVLYGTPCGSARSKTGDTNSRFVGAFKSANSGNTFLPFEYSTVSGMYRWHGVDLGAVPFRCLAGGSATIASSVDLSAIAPFVATTVYLFLQVIGGTGVLYIGKGGQTLDTTHFAFDTSFIAIGEGTLALVPYGGPAVIQTINYFVSSSTMQAYIDVFGFVMPRQ